jgi:poly-beta-1,6-N-acetyl-D-glucosamine synthase
MVVMMQLLAGAWISGLIILILSILYPWLYYIKMKNLSKNIIYPQSDTNLKDITIFLPVRNESKIIKQKLQEILDLNYPNYLITLLIIDTNSNDGTPGIAHRFLSSKEIDISWKIISLDRQGKSFAVNHALGIISTNIFIMMDADPILPKNCLISLIRWFQNPEIGAVCGLLGDSNMDAGAQYRTRFNSIRIGESILNSTPIFEGSICAFRMSAISKNGINSLINADDSQLSMDVRNNGFRAIVDPSLYFVEPPVKGIFSNHSRKVRRAHGLVKSLLSNINLINKDKKYGRIMFFNIYLYVFMPWLISLSSIIIFLTSIISIYESPFLKFNNYHTSLIFLFILPSSKLFLELIDGIFILIKAQILILFGRKLHIWETDQLQRILSSELRENLP